MKVVWLGNTNAKSTLSFSYNSGDRFKKKKSILLNLLQSNLNKYSHESLNFVLFSCKTYFLKTT